MLRITCSVVYRSVSGFFLYISLSQRHVLRVPADEISGFDEVAAYDIG